MNKRSENIPVLKIGLVIDDTLDTTDGVQQYVLTIAQWLRKQGHEVHFLSGQTGRGDLENLHSLSRNVKVNFNGNHLSIPFPVGYKTIARVLEEVKFDVLHVQMPYSPLLSGRIISMAANSTAVIGTFHIAPYGIMASLGSKWLGYISSSTSQRFDKVIAVSAPAAVMAKNMYKHNTVILGNAFNYHSYAAMDNSANHNECLEILFLGRLVKRKGCQTLLDALAILERSVNDLPTYRLTIAGDGPLRKHLEAFVRQNGLKDKVRFIGYVEEKDKPSYYASADIAVFPSISGESFGYVLVEAMSNGKSAIIAADNPGYASLLSGYPEMLFRAKDAISLASKLKEYIFNIDQRNKIAAIGQSIAKEFDIDEIGQKLVAYYLQALRKRRP